MDKSNRIIQLNPPSIPGDTHENQIKEVVDYIIDNAPPEALINFSKQFLTETFRKDPDKFQEYYKVYSEYISSNKQGHGQLIDFAMNKGANKCP